MLDKSIQHNKEYREEYRKAKRFDRSCRNHGSCPYCQGNREHSNKKRELSAKEKEKEND
jgi:5-methylcytosine-specific restriction endonuclease McrA